MNPIRASLRRLQCSAMEIIAAITDNGVIGSNGNMPWHLPVDLAHFKKLTTGHAIIMGRRTWESIGRALPNRVNIVITRQQDYQAVGAIVVHSFEDVIKEAQGSSIFVIGGGEIYAHAITKATRLHLTRIHTELAGDTYFPIIEKTRWICSTSEDYPADEKNQYCLTFQTWVRSQ